MCSCASSMGFLFGKTNTALPARYGRVVKQTAGKIELFHIEVFVFANEGESKKMWWHSRYGDCSHKLIGFITMDKLLQGGEMENTDVRAFSNF